MSKTRDPLADHFPVAGAGELQVGGLGATGGAVGVRVGVSWGSHGYAGGVMDEAEVRRLVAVLQDRLRELETAGPELRQRSPFGRSVLRSPELYAAWLRAEGRDADPQADTPAVVGPAPEGR